MGVLKEKFKIIYNIIIAKQYFFASVPFKGTDEDWEINKCCCISADECTPIFLNTVSTMSSRICDNIKNDYVMIGTQISSKEEAIKFLKKGGQLFMSTVEHVDVNNVKPNFNNEYGFKYRKGILYKTDLKNKTKEISWTYFESSWHDLVENKKYICYKKHYEKEGIVTKW